MEMIGVVAVIAVLASVATPMVFDAIRTARVTSFLTTVSTLRTATAQFYDDTGRLPVHIPSSANDGEQLLFVNSVNSPLPGWNGPYVNSELTNPFASGEWIALRDGTDAGQQFDFDGDGVLDTSNALFITATMSAEQGRRISEALDNDGDETSGSSAWYSSGRVRMWGGQLSSTVALIFIAEE